MATKIKIMKMLQEMRGFSELSQLERPKPCALFLMQLRTRPVHLPRPRHQIEITFDARDFATLPTPIEITHISQSAVDAG